MKLAKYLLVGVAALALVSCEKDDPTYANYIPEKTTPDDGPDGGDEGPEIPAGAIKAEVTVNYGTHFQTIKGFAASDCWAPQFIGATWSCRDEIATLLFDQSASGATTRGIGLSMWRVNLGAGTLEAGDASGITNYGRRAECYLDDNGDYDWTKCEGQRYWMGKAREMGVESFVLFSNSPLTKWTYNRQGRSDRGAKEMNIRPQYLPLFADYLADVAGHFKSEGYNVTHISPFNEPQYDWRGHDQEGSGWSVAQQADMVRALDNSLNTKGIDVDILPGEAASWNELFSSDNIISNYFGGGANDISSLSHVKNNLVCAHSYWTDNNWNTLKTVRTNVANAAAQYNAEVWQTEWSMLTEDYSFAEDEFPGYAAATEMDNSIQMSRVIHNDLVYAGVTSWSYWTSMDAGISEHKNRFVLIRLIPGGIDYTDGDGTYNTTTNLWVLGNYSLCIRPGYVRVETNVANESAQFFGSSYLSPDNTRLVSVYTNNTEAPFYLQGEFEGRDNVMAIKTYTTTETDELTPANVRTKDVVVIPAKSVVTVVYDL